MRLPTGRVMPTFSPTIRVAQLIITGIVKRVIMLLSAVSITERATSPPASLENTFEELPPGQQAISIRPMKNTGVSLKAHAKPKAIHGNSTSCPTIATTIGQGLRNTFPKSSNRSDSPKSNISSVSIGSTIQIVFISTFFFRSAKVHKSRQNERKLEEYGLRKR